MGIKERQDRDRAAVRDAILHAARELSSPKAIARCRCGRIAERIEYSPAAIYGYFASKDEIFFALAEEGFRTMQAAARAAPAGNRIRWPPCARASGPTTSSRASSPVLRADVRGPHSAAVDRHGALQVLAEMWHDGVASIARCVEAGIFPAALDVEAAFHILWAATHGAATLHVCQRLGPEREPRPARLRHARYASSPACARA